MYLWPLWHAYYWLPYIVYMYLRYLWHAYYSLPYIVYMYLRRLQHAYQLHYKETIYHTNGSLGMHNSVVYW